AELLPVFFNGRCPTAGDNAVFLMDITEASRFQRAPQTVALAEHEEAWAIGIGRRRWHRDVLQNNACRSGEERLFFLAPGDEHGAPAGLQHAKAFLERFGEVRKKHHAEAAGENVVRFAGERSDSALASRNSMWVMPFLRASSSASE